MMPDGTNYVLSAAQTTGTSDALDMQNWDGVVFIGILGAGTATGTLSLKVQQCTTSGGTYADLTGTSSGNSTATTDNNKMIIIDIFRPLKRYLKVITTRGTANTILEALIAIQYRGRKVPVTQATTTGQAFSHEVFISPAEGTA